MKPRWLSVTLAATLTSIGLGCAGLIFASAQTKSSPAQNLFEQASFYLTTRYHGYAKTNLAELVERFGHELEQCNSDCPYAKARTVIRRMLRTLNDGHTYYQTPEEFLRNQNSPNKPTPSTIPQLGWQLQNSTNALLVLELTADGPAAQAGVHRLDRISGINHQRFDGHNNPSAILHEASKTGQTITIEVLRGLARFELSLTPRILEDNALLPYLEDTALPSVVLLRIPDFETFGHVGTRTHQLVNQAIERGAQGIVVDLRDNPGGYYTECAAALGAFVGNHRVIFESRNERTENGYDNGEVFDNDPLEPARYTIANPAKFEGRIVTLVDAQSASCSEEFAYAIQRQQRGVVVGEQTYGILNTASNDFVLLDHSAITLTTVRALEPDGTPYPKFVTPDVLVQESQNLIHNGQDPMLEQALALLK